MMQKYKFLINFSIYVPYVKIMFYISLWYSQAITLWWTCKLKFWNIYLKFKNWIGSRIYQWMCMSVWMHTMKALEKVLLYNQFIWLILEYGSNTCSPNNKLEIDMILQVQKHYTKCLINSNENKLNYIERLKKFRINSLYNKCIIKDLLILHKLISPSEGQG